MRLGVIGVGKLGAPLAARFDSWGHAVMLYDDDPDARLHYEARCARGGGVNQAPPLHEMPWVDSVHALVAAKCEAVFIVVPTPHNERLDGTHPLTDERADFDYTALIDALDELSAAARFWQRETVVVVVSTVLPGTWRRLLASHVDPLLRYVYMPCFAAMGEVFHDLEFPELVVLGGGPVPELEPLLEHWLERPTKIISTDVTTAEGIKVAYNSWVTAKVTLANVWGELSERLGMNVNTIEDALTSSHKRIISDAYMSAGMGDGGPCHPRDNIALSWLAREHGLSFDLFGALMEARDAHARWIAEQLPTGVVLWGMGYKPGTAITDGSAAVLVGRWLTEQGKRWIDGDDCYRLGGAIPGGRFHAVLCAEERFRQFPWPARHEVWDPFGIIHDTEHSGVIIHRLGRP